MINGGSRFPECASEDAYLQSAGYTVQVTDDSGNGGAVLIEVYVIPGVVFIPGAPT